MSLSGEKGAYNMTNEKARDFFSAYHEGTIEPGLRVSFEQKLKSDSEIRHEFDSFVRAMSELDKLKFEEILAPEDLHERISASLDRHIFERKRSATPGWGIWIRGLSFAGVAGIAILGAIFAINLRNGRIATADGLGVASDQVDYKVSPAGMTVKLSLASAKTVVISNEGKVVSQKMVGDSATPTFETLLSNPLPQASVFTIQVGNDLGETVVGLPGQTRSTMKRGEGTVVDFAKAVSGYFATPVTIETRVPGERKSWAFTTSDVVTESSKALGSDYGVTLLRDGRLEIEEK